MTAANDPRDILAAIVRPADLNALVSGTNGSVCPDTLPSGNRSFKLRFRVDGQQRVVRLGPDPTKAATIANAIAWVQRQARCRRDQRRDIRLTRQSLQQTRRLLAQVRDEILGPTEPTITAP
jgi:hypothetical protein